MLKELLFKILGIDKQNIQVREIKTELQKETNAIVRKSDKLNIMILKSGITHDIATATGLKQ